MKKFLSLSLLVMLMALVAFVPVFAAATTAVKARVASVGAAGIESVVAAADAASGDTVAVEPTGSLRVSEFAELSSGAQNDDALILTGAGAIKSITAYSATAETVIKIYDAVTATGTPIVDITLDVANEQYTIPLNLDIGTGIYVDISSTPGSGVYSVFYNSD
jgi:hypothetical protein